jgi:N-acetylglutamate synthase-like GNAT family acetyltransferase/enamine deaminase RidA (YjgF/YER057c/UK114 family)
MRRNFGSGARWEEIVGYSRAVRVGNRICVTGTVGEGEGAYAQAVDALAKIAAVLERAGGGLGDVLRTRIFVTDIRRDWEAVGRAHREVLGEVMPATTMVEVSRLIDERYLVEIEADAELGDVLPSAHFNDADVATLLAEAGLPLPGAEDRPVQMRALERAGRVRACAGFERAGHDALLRSVAVAADSRGQGLGRELVKGLLSELAGAGVKQVYLLTMDADGFFARFGFETIDRAAVPEGILASREFEIHCCDSALVMRNSL